MIKQNMDYKIKIVILQENLNFFRLCLIHNFDIILLFMWLFSFQLLYKYFFDSQQYKQGKGRRRKYFLKCFYIY